MKMEYIDFILNGRFDIDRIICYHHPKWEEKEVIDYDRNEENWIKQLYHTYDYLGELQISNVHASWYHSGATIFLCLRACRARDFVSLAFLCLRAMGAL